LKQVKFLMNKDTGLNYHSKYIIKAPITNDTDENRKNKLLVFRDKLMQIPGIKNSTFTSEIPAQDISGFFSCYRKGFNSSDNKAYWRIDIDSSFHNFYDIKLLAGRFFRQSDREEMGYVLLNNSALKRLGYNNPDEAINQIVITRSREWTIIGVLRDFNFMSLKTEPVPTFFALNQRNMRYICLSYDPQITKSISNKAKAVFTSIYEGAPFEYYYLENKIEGELKSDKAFVAGFMLFAVMAIIIAIIGMLGLIIITVNRNVKEMGIRKVHGAKLSNIILLLMKHFTWELSISIVFAVPISIIGFQKWFLNNYIYSVELNWFDLALPVILLFSLLMIIIFSMAIKIIRQNTIMSLRYE
jgi:putative ABC transport system permease protein